MKKQFINMSLRGGTTKQSISRTGLPRRSLRSLLAMTKSGTEGFTLIELLVVIVIIGILASLLMVNYIGIRGRTRDAQRKSDLRQIQSALELYRSDSGSYPASITCNSQLAYSGTVYMQKVPCDPTNTSPYIYWYLSAYTNSAYTIGTCLENTNDQQKDSSNNPAPVDPTQTRLYNCTGGTTNWSYTLFSP